MNFLFKKEKCKAKNLTTVEISARDYQKFVAHFLQIQAVDINTLKDINNLSISSITINGVSQIENFKDIEIPISFFEKEKEFETSAFGVDHKGLVIEIENPNDFDVYVYFSLKGEIVF